MPATKRRLQRARAVARRIRRAPNLARRVGRTLGHRMPRRGPALSVVVPVYNVRDWVRPALESVLSQTLTDLQVIVVDDGSTDGSIDIVREYAARDPRIQIISQQNAGLGAARNTGAAHATGEFIAFFDSDDLVPPDAYDAMVSQLRASGSDFVTGAFARGNEAEAKKPGWVSRTMARNRSGLTIADEPDLLLDITAWNKVFRHSFWTKHDFRFVEGVRYEDQVPITRAYLTARSIDVLRQRVYTWRTRIDGSSITQQKASILDLADRLRSQQECAELMSRAPAGIREAWYLKLLNYDLPNYLIATLNADEKYTELLRSRLESLRDEVPENVWHRVAFRNRSKSWVLSQGRLDRAADLRAWFEQESFGLPVEERAGHLEFVPPFDLAADSLPPWLCRVHDVDIHPVVRLVETFWDDDTLVLRGSAYLAPVPQSHAPHHLELRLVGPGDLSVEVEVTRFSDPSLDALARMTHLDLTDSGFEARIDGDRLAALAPAGRAAFGLEFRQRQGPFERVSDITNVFNVGSGGSRQPRECQGRMVRLAGVVNTGHRILVHDTYAWSTGHRALEDGAVEIALRAPADDPVVLAWLKDSEAEPLPLTTDEDGTARIRVVPDTGRVLMVRHRSGERSPVIWGAEDNVAGHETGGFVHRGTSQRVVVDERRPAVLIREVSVAATAVTLRGTSLGAAGRRLFLRSPRSSAVPSAPLPSGPFELDLPIQQDPWGLGRTALAAGSYTVELAPSGEPVAEHAGNQDDDGYVVTDTSVRGRLPIDADVPGQRLVIGVTHTAELSVESRALAGADASPRHQGELRDQTYPRARAEEPRAVVLFETFNGRTAGDSPAAIARELLDRGTELDLVWSIADGSVPPPEGMRGVHRFSAEWYDLLGRAAYLVSNNNFPYFFRKSEHQTYLQTWHGTPLKRIANDVADKQFFSVTYQRTMSYEAKAWDYLVSPSPYCSEILPRAFDFRGPVLETGYPRNDALVSERAAATRDAVRRRLGISPDDRVLLYAPTWRESAKSATGHAKVLHLDPHRVVDAVPGTVVLVRGHANTAMGQSVAGQGRRVIDVTLYPEISDLFLASDLLVTDYSSVMFDFAVLDRPMAFLVPDLASYRDTVRGFYFDFAASAPGPLLDDEESLVEYLRNPDDVDLGHEASRKAFRARFAPLDDGHAAARVVDQVFAAHL